MKLTVTDQTVTIKLSEEQMRAVTEEYILEHSNGCDTCPVRDFYEDPVRFDTGISCEAMHLEFLFGSHRWKALKSE